MKTFNEFLFDCQLVEGKVEWDNPKRPLQSGLTPREKNRAKRISLGIEQPHKTSFGGGRFDLTVKDYERYGKLKLAHEDEKGKKVQRNKRHEFREIEDIEGTLVGTRGKKKRNWKQHKNLPTGNSKLYKQDERQKVYHHNDLKEPKENYEYSIDEGKIPWDDKNRPLRSGWTPREKNRAKRISTGVENPEHSPSEKKLERYGKLKSAHDEQKNVKTRKNQRHKNPEDYSIGRKNVFFKPDRRMPSENIVGNNSLGLPRMPRNYSKKDTPEDFARRSYGAKNDEKRDKYYEKGPKGLKEPKN